MISLQGSLKTCKADTAWAERLQSNRFEDPDNMVCIPWSGRDLVGRPINENSFYTKAPGCNTPADRVGVENTLRPQYMETTTTDAYGFRADLFEGNKAPLCKASPTDATDATDTTDATDGLRICPFYPYDWHIPDYANIAKYSRVSQFLQHQTKAYEMLNASGFG